MARSNDRSPRTPTDWNGVSHALSTVLTAVLVLGLIAGLSLGLGPLEARAAGVLGVRPTKVTIDWPTYQTADGSRATWLAEALQEEIMDRAHAAAEPGATNDGMFRRDALRAVGEAMRTSGWFDGTPTVTRRTDGEIHVEGTWRIPAAVVRSGALDRLVSWTGAPMPVEYPAGKARGQTVILGVGAPAPTDESGAPSYIGAWPGEDLQAGLELHRLLSTQAWRDQIAAIDVRGYEKSRLLVIVTKRDGRIEWGGRPSAPRVGDVSTASKIAHLEHLNRELRSIDANLPSIEIWGAQPLEINVSASSGAP